MKSKEFISKAVDIANNYKTLYVMGCFGSPMNAQNKKRYTMNHSYNKQPTRTAMIQAASADTYGFDCVCYIKAILWGWKGDTSTYGGAVYKSNGVPDVSADGMIKLCTDVSITGWENMIPGEAVWLKGHIGIYIGDGLVAECSPAWKNKVQITAVANMGGKAGYNSRKWTSHGKIPYVDYTDQEESKPVEEPVKPADTTPVNKTVKASVPAQKYNKNKAGAYVVTASALNVRDGGSVKYKSLGTLPKGTKVTNYGYYSADENGTVWLYVTATANGVNYTGFCSSTYLKR